MDHNLCIALCSRHYTQLNDTYIFSIRLFAAELIGVIPLSFPRTELETVAGGAFLLVFFAISEIDTLKTDVKVEVLFFRFKD